MTGTSLRFVGTNARVSDFLTRAGRLALWLVVLTASIKPAEIFGPGEQSWVDTPPSDLVFRGLILGACALATLAALLAGRLRRSSLLFLPFLLWAFFVAVARQSDLSSAKQIGSYASWIFFYIAACALFRKEQDYRLLTTMVVAAVCLSAFGGELQHWLGYGPGLGSMWPEGADMEFKRTHTGAGGILLDAFTPYCGAFLLLSTAGGTLKRHATGWILALWGTANILRGGLLAFAVGMCWFLWRSSRRTRRYILIFMGFALLCGLVLFGGTLADKVSGSDGEVNTSGRLDEWPQLLQWIAEEPLIGHGPDADMELLAKSATGRDLRASHNELLSTAINYGVIGVALLWVPLLILLVQSVARGARSSGSMREQLCGASAILIMGTLLGFTDNTLRSPGFMILTLAPAAVMANEGRRRAVSQKSKEVVFASS